MASVTFPSSLGGDNSTVTDDSSPTTGLGGGGHRTRFVPALAQMVAICSNAIAQIQSLISSYTATLTGYVTSAQTASNASAASANFKGNWSSLAGALNMPASVAHGGQLWLLNANVADVATKTPGVASEWTLMAFNSTSVKAPVQAVAALAVDCSLSTYFTKSISGNSTFTFSGAPNDRAFGFTLELTHTSGTVTWPAAVKWPQDTAPTLTTGKTHLFMFVTDDGGTRWRGAALANYTN